MTHRQIVWVNTTFVDRSHVAIKYIELKERDRSPSQTQRSDTISRHVDWLVFLIWAAYETFLTDRGRIVSQHWRQWKMDFVQSWISLCQATSTHSSQLRCHDVKRVGRQEESILDVSLSFSVIAKSSLSAFTTRTTRSWQLRDEVRFECDAHWFETRSCSDASMTSQDMEATDGFHINWMAGVVQLS